MSERAEKYEAFLDDLAPIVDGDAAVIERHADFLVDDDEARDLRHEATAAADRIREAGADFVMPVDFEARVLASLDEQDDADPGRITNPGFASPDLPSSSGVRSADAPASDTLAKTEAMPARSDAETPRAKPDAAAETAEKGTKRRMGKLLFFPVAGVIAVAAAAAVGLLVWGGDDGADPAPQVASAGLEGTLGVVERAADDGQSGVSVQRPGQDGFVALGAGERAPTGSVLRTDARTRARFSLGDGSVVVLNHATEVALTGEGPRALDLRSGEIVADVAHLADGPNLNIQTPTGAVEVLGTELVVSATDEMTSVRVTRGVVAVRDRGGARAEVRAGEEGILRPSAPPSVAPVTDLSSSVAWSELGAIEADDDARSESLAGIGSLRARRPGQRGDQERPLALASHKVTVRIVGNVARTEIEEVFRNDGDHTLEGIYRFPLPPDAQIASLALDVEGRMEEGSFVERDRAAQIWRGVIRNATPVARRDDSEEFIWVPGPWHDPALLEWQRGGQFELRVFPIPAHGERRVTLAYTQTVQPQGARRRYVYPLAHSNDASTQVGHFEVDVRVAGADGVSPRGYALSTRQEEGATRLAMEERDFLPKGDLVIDYALPGGERDLRWWTFRGQAAEAPPEDSRERDREVNDLQRRLADDDRPYVAFALRPELPRATERRARDYVMVVDASQSMVGERYDRAVALTSRVVREMDRRDRFTVLACDYQCRAMPGGLQGPSAQIAGATEEWLDSVEPAGASDLVAVLAEAVATAAGERRDGRELHVMYVGDGTSSVGYRRAASISAETRGLVERERVAISTVGIGGDADTMVLGAIARAGGGHYVPYVPGQRASAAAMAVLETSYGASLESPRLELPDGLSDVAPTALPTIRAGQEVIVVARMDRDRVQGSVRLHGSVAGRPFEERYPVELVPSDAEGNRFVPQLWAAKQIEQLQLEGDGSDRGRIIALSKGFGVMSRHTSLLVLESEAMFRAFRVDRRSSVPHWTGDEDAEAGESDGVLQAEQQQAGLGALGTIGAGRGGGGALRGRRAARARPAPATPAASADSLASGPGYATGGSASRAIRGDAVFAGGAAPPMDNLRDERRNVPDDEDRAGAEDREASRTQTEAAPTRRRTRRRRGPGQWMRRVWVRTGEVRGSAEPSTRDRSRADDAEAALRENPDSRDRHRDAYRALARAERLDRALEVVDAWIERDRLDPEALTAKADVLGRMGRRDEALRLLTGTVDLSPDGATLHQRLARAFERVGREERACAHRIALAEIDESDASAVADAMRCERALGRDPAATRLLSSVRDASVRTRAERLARREDEGRRFRGDFTVEAEWSGDDDVDVSILTRQGTRLSWMGGRTTVVGADANGRGRERLGLRWTAPGTYVIEVSRTDPNDTREIRGHLDVRVLGQRQRVPFTLRGEREAVARVRVRRESRLERVTGTVNPGF